MEKYVPPYSIDDKMLFLVSSIMEKLGKIDSFDNLNNYPILRKQNRIKSIHSSCAIEANSLSLDEVKDVINGKEVIGPKKDILEVQNAIKAYSIIDKINPLKEEELKKIHSIIGNNLMKGPDKYRNGNEGVFDENGNVIFYCPPPNLVPSLMKELFGYINKECKNISPLILSSVFHYEFVFIHPFSDGNGRCARYWQTAMLGKWKKIFYWLPIENQIYKYQDLYYKAINKSNVEGNSNAFINFMLMMIDKTLDEVLENANDEKNTSSIYINKLFNVLKINVWYTSNEILSLLNLKSKETLRKNYINPAIKLGYLILEYPNKPTSKNQRYKLTK